MLRSVMISLLILSAGFWVAKSVDCSSATTSSSCTKISGCTWQSTQCLCASQVAMDIAFALDASGSIGSSNFDTGLDFVSELIISGLPTEARVGIIRFATVATLLLDFNTSQLMSTAQIAAYVQTIKYTGGYTNTVQAIQVAMALFESESASNRAKVLALVTDGNPYVPGGDTDVCAYSSSLKSEGIEVVIIGVGSDWDPANVDCLVTDTSKDIIPVSSYSTSAFDAALPQITDITCPVTYNLIITEVQPVPIDSSHGSRFVEIYNAGSTVEIYDIVLLGIFSGSVTTNSSITLAQGQYLVIYDADVSGSPNCTDCTSCTLSNSKCTNALYMPCTTNGGTCWFSGGSSLNTTNWYMKLLDSSDGSIINEVYYGSGWPSIYTGYSYELKSKGYDNSQSGNWQMSCNVRGTPGADPISSCSATCVSSQCQLNGDSGAFCNSNQCYCSGGYYAVSGTFSCDAVPPPGNCYAYWKKNGYTLYATYVWDAASTDAAHNYSLVYSTDKGVEDTVQTSSRTKDVSDYDWTRNSSESAGTVHTLIGVSQSIGVDCIVVTLSPTTSPTPSPTALPNPSPTLSPTPKPTYESPTIFIGGDICETDRCSCYGKMSDCTGPDIYKEYVPSTQVQYITVKKFPIDFPDLVYVWWKITSLGATNMTSSSTRRRRLLDILSTAGPLITFNNITYTTSIVSTSIINATNYTQIDGIEPTDGYIVFNNSYEQKISLTIESNIVSSSSNSVSNQLFKLELLNCSTTQYCELIYPYTLYLIINNNNSPDNLEVNQNSIPSWLWWLIGVLIIFLFFLAWLVYRYWWRHKQTSQQLNETQQELDAAVEENELGFGREVGVGDVTFNPIATGVPGTSKAPQFSSDTGLNQQDTSNQRVDVPVQKFAHREQLGQVAPSKGNSKPISKNNQNLKEPLLSDN